VVEVRAAEWRCLATVAITLSAEIALVRVSAGAVVAADALCSLLLGNAVAVAFLVFSRIAELRSAPASARVSSALAVGAPLLTIGLGIAVPVVARELGSAPALGVTALGAGWLVLLVRRAAGGAAPLPTWSGLALVGATSSFAWLAGATGLPPLSMLAALAVLGLVFAWLSFDLQRAFAAPALAAALVALPPISSGNFLDRDPFGGERVPGSGPDIVLLTVDTLRADVGRDMESYRRIAERGAAFTAAQSPAPWTLPSMATLLSGVEMERHGARRRPEGRFGVIDPGLRGVAARLSAAGYDTAAVVSPNPFVGEHFGFGRGFDLFMHAGRELRFALPRVTDDWGYGDAQPVFAALAMRLSLLGRPVGWDADVLTGRALEIAARPRERPLFLWVHFLDAHLPYRHLADSGLDPEVRRRLEGLRGHQALLADPFWGSEAGRDALTRAYRHEVARVDAALLALLDGLGPEPSRGRIVALGSDHGEEFLDHGGLEHGHTLHQELLAIPLAVAGLPGLRPGTRIETPVGLADLAATLVRGGGANAEELPGRDLALALEARPVLSGNLLYGEPDAQLAVRESRWKLIRNARGSVLYDLERDPAEHRDIADLQPELVARLAELTRVPVLLASPAPTLSREDASALRALGYAVD
jgi:arylsulfatase A-like enzyme